MAQHIPTVGEPAVPGENGFTIIEVMVASFVLLVGMLGVLTMLTGMLGTTKSSNARVAATNLARELVETTRGLDYDNLGLVVAQVQARGLGPGTPWTIQRRGVTYTVTATTCAFDDPTDGYAATAPANACNVNAVGTDSNGDDFRRVTFQLAWSDGGRSRSMSQTTLIVNPAGGLGPRITKITPLTQTITLNTNPTLAWETTPAQSLRWEIDDGKSNGSVTGSTAFTTIWNIGIAGSGTEVLDGSYTISGQAFDDRDIAGEAKRADIVLNRSAPYAPTNFAGGHDTRAGDWVDFDWSLNRERDILGYRVVWAGPDGALGNGNDQQVCPAPSAGSMLAKTTTSCADFTPQPGVQTYYIVAIDRDNTASAAPRDGAPAFLTINAAGSRPSAPAGLAVAIVNSQPKLSWNASAGAVFYRIYRDGTSFSATTSNRWNRTSDATTTFTDASPDIGGHTYRVTAVDSTYNESDPSGPVTAP
jgi:prepilin-type N-terminal cleavage/methylation domain-containing protein